MSEQRVYKDFIDGVETETNTEGCTTVKLNDGKTYQTYPYPGFGFVGNSCGLYIQKATPATTEAKKQLWFDIPPPEEGKEPIVTKIVIEDRSSLSEDSLKLFDDYISKYTNDKTPNEILEILNRIAITLNSILTFQIMIISRGKLLEEIITMHQN